MKREIWKGSEAIAEAAIRAGCRGFFGYPITPQNEIPEYMSLKMPQAGGVFVQAESEVAAINRLLHLSAGRYGCRRYRGIHKAPRIRHGHYTDHAIWQALAAFLEATLKPCS